MHTIARVLKGLLKAAVFFTLFAFALNNQDAVTVHFFFGHQWTLPMVLVVFAAFASGLLFGILGMVPRWWRQRTATTPAAITPAPSVGSTEIQAPHHGI
jgi:lipopolysaccharide assembly protein A